MPHFLVSNYTLWNRPIIFPNPFSSALLDMIVTPLQVHTQVHFNAFAISLSSNIQRFPTFQENDKKSLYTLTQCNISLKSWKIRSLLLYYKQQNQRPTSELLDEPRALTQGRYTAFLCEEKYGHLISIVRTFLLQHGVQKKPSSNQKAMLAYRRTGRRSDINYKRAERSYLGGNTGKNIEWRGSPFCIPSVSLPHTLYWRQESECESTIYSLHQREKTMEVRRR